jgi:hypothetical protein
MWRRGSYYGGGMSSGGSSLYGERKKLVCSVGAKKRAARKWTSHGLRLLPSLLPLVPNDHLEVVIAYSP